MGFGRYRFRRSFGNVTSQFRGARFDTYPLRPYPLAGRVLDLSKFTFTSSDVPDISGENNDAVLYSGKGVNLDGTGDYVELPAVTTNAAVTDFKILARSSTDTKVPTSLGSGTIVADDTWQEVEVETVAKNNGDKLWFNGADTYIDYGSSLLPATGDFDTTFYWYIGESSVPAAFLYALEQGSSAATTSGITLSFTGTIQFYANGGTRISTSADPYYNTLVKVQFKRTSDVFDLLLNDSSIGTWNGAGWSIEQVNTRWGNSSFLAGRHITGQVYGDDVTGTQNGTFETTTQAFTDPDITLGTGYTGDLADARLYDTSSSLLDEFYLNEHTDTAANGLDGLPVVGRNGNIGQYVGCAAVVQEGMDSALAGLGNYGDKMWFTDTSVSVQMGDWSAYTNATLKFKTLGLSGAVKSLFFSTGTNWLLTVENSGSAISSESVTVTIDGTTCTTRADAFAIMNDSNVHSVVITGNFVDLTDVLLNNFVDAAWDNVKLVFDFELDYTSDGTPDVTWDGTEAGAISNGWTVNGSPNSIAELRKQPPQVLGMNHKNYMRFDGVDDYIDTGTTIPEFNTSGEFYIKFNFIPQTNASSFGNLFGGREGISVLGGAFIYIVNGTMQLRPHVRTSSGLVSFDSNTVLEVGKNYVIEVIADGSLMSLKINGVLDANSVAYDGTINSTINNYRIGDDIYEDPINGAIYNLTVSDDSTGSNVLFTWDGTTQDAETNGWTVNGTPDNLLVSESLNAGIDALGNALTPRTSKTFNADGSGYAIVPDDNSLDLTTEATWVMKGNFYGTGERYHLSKYNTSINARSWGVGREAVEAADEFRLTLGDPVDGTFEAAVKWSGLTDENGWLVITYNAGTLKAYWKGLDLGAATIISGVVPSSLFVSAEPVYIGALYTTLIGYLSDKPTSDIKIYNRELTAEEVAEFV